MKRIILSIVAIGLGITAEAQNVGIGTATPTEKLHVQGGARVTSLSGTGNRLVQSNATGVLSNIALGTNGQILYNIGGVLQMSNPLVDNGLYYNTGAARIRLGGALVENTTITQGNFQMVYNLTGSGDFTIQDAGALKYQMRDDGISTWSAATAAPYVLGNNTPVHTMYYPFEIGSDGNGGLQATIGYYRASDVEVNPETGGWGYVGYDVAGAGDQWWRMYSNGYIVSSRREIKHNIHAIDDNGGMENYLVNTIKSMRPSVYNYYNEYDEMIPGKENHFRPAFRMGLIVDETPDFLLDEGFSGVDIYGLAALSLAGVQHNMKEIDAMKQTQTIQDFGSVAISSDELWISYAEDFNGVTPVVTITSNNPNVVISVVEKNASQFKVKVSEVVQGLQIDWIAMAKKQVINETGSEELTQELKDKFEVPEATKNEIKEFYKTFESTISPPSGK